MRYTRLFIPVMMIAAAAGSSRAQTNPSTDDTTFVPADAPPAVSDVISTSGSVVSIDPAAASLVVETSSGPTTFSVDPQAVVFEGEQGGLLSDLHVGDPVSLTYSQEGLVNRVVRLEAERPRSTPPVTSSGRGIPPVILPTAIGLVLLATAMLAIRSTRRAQSQVHI